MNATVVETPRPKAGPVNLDKVFRAQSVALIGVSAEPQRLNAAPLRILLKTGFKGRVLLVNPKYTEINGIPCYKDVASLPETPEMAMIMVPAAAVPDTIDACGKLGTEAAIVLSSGFEELEGGNATARRLADIAAKHRMAVVGPNCEGVWSVRSRVILTFGSAANREVLHHAPIAILSQSGAIAGGISRHLQDRGVGCAYLVSVGNETCLGMLDYLEWMLAQDDVKVVLMFIEGLKDGGRLLSLAAKARARGVQLVALKSGNTALGEEAVASHTGKIATPYTVYRDVFQQAGIIQVNTLSEMIEAGEILSHLPTPPRREGQHGGVSVCSIPGGTRALTVDQCAGQDVPVAVFADETQRKLKEILPRFGYAGNPTDLTGQALSSPDLFGNALRLVAADPNSEALIVQLANRGPHDAKIHAGIITEAAKSQSLPTVISFLGDTGETEMRRNFLTQGIACARDPADAVKYLSWLYKRREFAGLKAVNSAENQTTPRALTRTDDQIAFLKACGIDMPAWRALPPGGDIKTICKGLRWPVAVKANPDDADHKTEKGLLSLNVTDEAGVAAEASRICAAMGRGDAVLMVQEMIVGGVEAVLSVRRDADFGAVLSIGSGGVMVELFQDMVQLAAPVDNDSVHRALQRLKLTRLLEGFRGKPAADVDALVIAAVRLTQAFQAQPGLREIELNPVLVLPKGKGIVAVDLLMKNG